MKETVILAIGTLLLAGGEAMECEEYKCYEANAGETSFLGAVGYCGQFGALAAAKNTKELDALNRAIERNGGGEHWIGGSCEGSCSAGNKAAWYWVKDKSPVTLDYWADGEPNDNVCTSPKGCEGMIRGPQYERVMTIRDGQFYDRAYWEFWYFVCEYCSEYDTDDICIEM